MSDFRPYDWTDDALANANDATAAAGSNHTRIYSGNQINALICEVQAWRREHPDREFVSGPNKFDPRCDGASSEANPPLHDERQHVG